MHTAIAVAAIALYILGGSAQTRVSGLPLDFRSDELSYPVTIGQYTVDSEPELLARVAGEPYANPLRLRSFDGATDVVLVPRKLYTPVHNIINRINGLFFLAVSLIVFAPRIDKIPARDLFWACLLYGLAVMIGGIYQPQGKLWPGALWPMLRIVALVVLPILMFHVGLSFPRRTSILDRCPWLMPTVIVLGLAVAGWQAWSWMRWFEGAGDWEAIDLPRRAGGVFLAVFFGTGCGGMVHGYRSSHQEREREQVKWLLWGIAMGSVPFVFFHALPLALGREPLFPIEVARLFSIVIPIAMSFVVIRHKFLDVDIIIRRSLLYVLLASMMVGIYGVIGIFIGQRVVERWPETGPFVPVFATMIAAILFTPTRQGFAQLIDRVFFKIRYDHAQALTAFRLKLREVTDQQQIADSLTEFLTEHLGPTTRSVILHHEGQRYLSGKPYSTEPSNQILPPGVSVMAMPGQTARPDIETEGFPAVWQDEKFVLAHAIEAEGNRFGHLALGEKSTGRSYVAEDLDLLAAATRESALCMRRMNLEQDFVDEVVARHRMEEMNRFRTEFFAQFAHDLRSPLTSINWGARNLLDGVVGQVTGPQKTYLEGIETSARQLVRLVNNLLEATRLESGLPEVSFQQLNLVATIEESVSKLRATAEAKNLNLVVKTPEVAEVYGNEEKLLEVIDNLIENAIRYAPPDTRINVVVSAEADRVRLVVEDRGPGMDLKDLDAIFEPYRQGAASPHSTQQGFGLGLFVVKSWVEKMGGKVHAGNREDGGARFTIVLPSRETPVQEASE
ncbi:MAG: HAMP domain-containing sensor histidine kinase [Candidatus Krumholzibacteria bacterium]|nr:HAMP domain-containing sensor histidine kinase [Candidatus Krumholzibacteria bacterium]